MTFSHTPSRRFALKRDALLLLVSVFAFGSCDTPTAPPPEFRWYYQRPVATVRVSPTSASVMAGQTVQLTATLRDAYGNRLTGRVVTWTTSNAAVATVSNIGLVTGVAAGSAKITATSEGKSGTAAVTVTPVPVASVNMSPASGSVPVGQTLQITATPQDTGGNALTGRVATWTSSNAGVATVSASGLVTGVAAGSVTITATSEGKSGTAAITVTQQLVPVGSVSVDPASANLTTGQTAQLTATTRDSSGSALTNRVVTWSTSDAGVATVSGSGLVTGVAAGSVTITATSEGKSGTSAVTVTLAPVASVSVNPASASLVAGQTVQLSATPRDAGGSALTGRVVTWTTSDAGVATVSGTGLVTGAGAGSATITATSEAKSGTAVMTVTSAPQPVASVGVSPATVTATTGQKVQLTATPRDAAGNALAGRVVTWGSNSTAVATVSASGLVTGVSAGSATITATSEGKSGTAAVTVTLAPVASVSVSPASASVVAGQTVQLIATPRDANGTALTGRVVTWVSSNTAGATVTGSGLVTGASAGSVTITATSEGVNGTAAVTVVPVASNAAFPLHVDAGKRYLVDAAGNPFLLRGDAPWSLIVQLTNAEAEQYLEDRRQKGFNTVLVNLIEHQFSSNPPKNAYGEMRAPFLTPGDFSTPNEAYFAHAAYVINLAAQKGILVLLTPAYMGSGGGSEGWYQEMAANGTTKLGNYGTYLANRFRAYDNIVWVEGGDYNPPSLSLLRAIPNAIRAAEPKWLHTFSGSRGTSALGFLGTAEPWLQINDIYTDQTTVVANAFQEYGRSSMPFFLLEATYENEGANEAVVRQQAYQAVLSGGTGHIMGNNPIWQFGSGWQTALNSRGARTLAYLPALLTSRAWWTLVPDIAHTVLTAGVGSGSGQAATARATNGSVVLAYLPSARSVTVNLAQLSGPNVVARWYDPANGTYAPVAGSPFAASGARSFASAGANSSGSSDWVLVLESSP